MPRKPLRKIWLKLHAYLGLVLGAPLAVIGLTGSLIVFGWPLDAWLNQDLMRVNVPVNAHPLPPQDIIDAARRVLPPAASPLDWLQFPTGADGVFRVSYTVPPSPDSYEVFIDSYTAKVLGQRLWGDFGSCCSWHGPLMTVLYRFHDSFWLGETGQIIVGGIGLVMLLSLLSGIVLWFPSPGHWRQALSLKKHASWERKVFDWHKLMGVYSIAVLAGLFFTGAYLNFPKQSQALVNLVSPLTQPPTALKSQAKTGLAALNANDALQQMRHYFPDKKLYAMSLPIAPDDAYEFYFFSGFELMPDIAESVAYLDPYNGELLYAHNADHPSAGDVFNKWQLALHSGQAFGLAGQITVMLCGLAPSVLFATGLIRWRQKQRSKRQKAA
jgi:uncharacterized iron-regulated membrane protein